MSIYNEKQYNRFKALTYLEEKGTPENPGPFWVAKFLWDIDPTRLPDNRSAVAAVMHVTDKMLLWNPEWREIYESQLRCGDHCRGHREL